MRHCIVISFSLPYEKEYPSPVGGSAIAGRRLVTSGHHVRHLQCCIDTNVFSFTRMRCFKLLIGYGDNTHAAQS